ncbi:MAG: hypothetical protein M3M87_02465, partial [Thermoproteota archaeon]|nr:hypothetical protein [Thermoproteota archaeon]
VNATNNQTEAIGVPLQDPLVTNATTLNGEIGSIQGAQQQLFARGHCRRMGDAARRPFNGACRTTSTII